jgi:SAM-dependent methyltransferase
MLFWILFIFFILFMIFNFVVIFGAPYLPTLKPQIQAGLKLLDLQPGQTMLELGCGDGRVLKAAAEQGIKCIGYELNPILVLIARYNTRKYKDLVTIHWGDYWKAPWPRTDGIFVFLLKKYMKQLDTRIVQWYSSEVKLVSYAFKIPGREPSKELDGLYLYEYERKELKKYVPGDEVPDAAA